MNMCKSEKYWEISCHNIYHLSDVEFSFDSEGIQMVYSQKHVRGGDIFLRLLGGGSRSILLGGFVLQKHVY